MADDLLDPNAINARALANARNRILENVAAERDARLRTALGIEPGRSLVPTFEKPFTVSGGNSFVAPTGTPSTSVNYNSTNQNGTRFDPIERQKTLANPLVRIQGLTDGITPPLSEGTRKWLAGLEADTETMSDRQKAAMKIATPEIALNELARKISSVNASTAAKAEYRVAILAMAEQLNVPLSAASLSVMNNSVGFSALDDARNRQAGVGNGGVNGNFGQEPSTAGKVVNIAANVLGGLSRGMEQNRNGGGWFGSFGGNQQGIGGNQQGGWLSGMINYFRS